MLAVRWYISYRLSLRDLAEMLAERGLDVYPSTIWRWVQRSHLPSRRALWLLRRENLLWRYVKVRTCKYLNNIVEQDHRAIKRRCSAMHGLKAFGPTAVMIAGIELDSRSIAPAFYVTLGSGNVIGDQTVPFVNQVRGRGN